MKVLLVDDEPSIRRAISRTLARAGYDVTTAEDVADAKGLLRGESFDLLLCDLRLPSGSGHEVVAAAREVAPQMKVILLSGDLPEEDAHERHLSKPFGARELVDAIVETLAA